MAKDGYQRVRWFRGGVKFRGGIAAERRKICSPRRQPWVTLHQMNQPQSGETRNDIKAGFRPCRGWFALAFLSHGSRHGLQIFCRSAADSNHGRKSVLLRSAEKLL